MTKTTPLPFIKPCEPTLAKAPPTGDRWSHELKWDGWRLQITKDRDSVRFRTRRGRDIDLPGFARALAALPATSVIIDAELVASDPTGRCDISALRRALARHNERALVVRVFDLLHLNARDLTHEPLHKRQARLARLVERSRIPFLLLSEGIAGDGAAVLTFAEANRLEGIVSKRLDAPYRSGRSRDWLKIKTRHWRKTRAPQIARSHGTRTGSRTKPNKAKRPPIVSNGRPNR